MQMICDKHIKNLEGVRASLFRDYAKKLKKCLSQKTIGKDERTKVWEEKEGSIMDNQKPTMENENK
jgi:hypothetical protein